MAVATVQIQMVVTVAVAVVVIQFHVTGDGTRAPIFLYKFQFHGRCGGVF